MIMMYGRALATVVSIVAIGAVSLPAGPAAARGMGMGDFTGGLLGGVIAGAIIANQRPRPVVVYRPRPAYRVVHRYYYAPPPRRVVVSPSHPATMVNTAADPFAASKPTTPIPVSAKP